MQTRRDQLHAYKFQNRRALAALVAGEPNVVEPPMRRLTVTTISGIMIAILIACGFAIVGVFKPTTGDKWKDPGAIIVERETGARYVLLDDNELHPVLNYSSAVLAVGTKQKAHVVLVDRSDLKNAQRGATVGIDGIPDSLPSASNLISSPWTVCSRQQAGKADQLDARVSVRVGDEARSRHLPANTGVLVRTIKGDALYLLLQGRRLLLTPTVATSLGLPTTTGMAVGTAFLNGVPAGPDLKAPDLPRVGKPSAIKVDGKAVTVGQLLHIQENNQYFLVLADGVAKLDPVQTALLRTLTIGSGGQPLGPLDTTESVALGLPTSVKDWPAVLDKLAGLPDRIPDASSAPAQSGGVCAIYRNGSTQPVFAVPPKTLPAFSNPGVSESAKSKTGVADDVVLSPGRAAVVKTGDRSTTVFVVADPGRKFAASSKDVLAGFGYESVQPAKLPIQLLPLIPTGPALDPNAARQPISG